MTTIEKIGVLAFLTVIAIIYWMEIRFALVYAISKYRGISIPNPFITKFAIVIHFFAIIGILCMLYGFFIEPYWIQVNTVEIKTAKLSDTSFKIVHISDTHCDRKPRNEKNLVKIVNAIKPDLILFTGDAINTDFALPRFKETMKSLNAPLGKFAVFGNHEVNHWSHLDLYSDTGFKVLGQDTDTIEKNNESIAISGLSAGRSELYPFKALSPDQFSILLYHYPGLIENIQGCNVDLHLAGHTHGGQIALPFYGALVTLAKHGKKYESGQYTVGDTILYVNRGIGMEGSPAPPVRFLARPEITIFNIVPDKQTSTE